MSPSNSTLSSDYCTTPACLKIAEDIASSMTQYPDQVDPCTNFEEYVCSNWNAVHPTPPGKPSNSGQQSPEQAIKQALRDILENPYPVDEGGWITVSLTEDQKQHDQENFDKLQGFYGACTNFTARATEGLKPLVEVVETLVSLFPTNMTAASSTNETTTYDHSNAMAGTLSFLTQLGIQTTQDIHVAPSSKNRTKNEIWFRNTFDVGPLTGAETEEDLTAYGQITATLLAAVHPAKPTVEEVTKIMQSVLQLEIGLLTIFGTATAERGPVSLIEYVPNLTLAELHEMAPQFNFPLVVEDLSGKKRNDEEIFVEFPDYFKNASALISQTTPEVLRTYFIWKTMVQLAGDIEAPEADLYNNLFRTFRGRDPKEAIPRWARCVDFVSTGVSWMPALLTAHSLVGPSGLTWPIVRFFAEGHWSPNATSELLKMTEAIHETVKERFEGQDWLSEQVKEKALRKLEAMTFNVALTSDLQELDPTWAKEYYADKQLSTSHFANALTLGRTAITRHWSKLDEVRESTPFAILSPIEQNAIYITLGNSIDVNLGFVQDPLYDNEYPSYLRFGGIGSIIGHEIIHGFDEKGRLFNEDGELDDWWDKESLEAFEEKSHCFIDQYSEYSVVGENGTDVHLDGAMTVRENVPDTGGVVSSFETWQKWRKQHEKDKKLPGLDHITEEQLFFVQWARTWCNDIAPAVELTPTNEHAPYSVRTYGPLENSKGFLEAFQCKQKEPKCELW